MIVTDWKSYSENVFAGYRLLRAALQNIWGDHRHRGRQLFGQIRQSYQGVLVTSAMFFFLLL